MESLQYIGSEHCGLCRLQFPPRRLQGVDAWQSNFRALLRLDPKKPGSFRITNPISFNSDYEDTDINLTDCGRSITIVPYTRQFIGSNDQSVQCFHDWCYECLTQEIQGCTNLSIHTITQILPTDAPFYKNTYPAPRQLDPLGRLRTLVSHVDLQPISIMKKLPTEIRSLIWGYTGFETAASSYILVAGEAARLVRAINLAGYQDISREKGSDILVKMISVFGRQYIRGFLVLRVVTRIDFAIHLGGLCAIKIFSVDGDSGWFGYLPETSCVWYGTISGPCSDLSYIFNGLYYTNIATSDIFSAGKILWDRPDIPSSLTVPDVLLWDFPWNQPEFDNPRSRASWRFLRYLPLLSGNEYVVGLTVYISGNITVGLEAHFNESSQLSGHRKGCPIHFPLCPNERIAHVWLRFVNSSSIAFARPAVVIQTTFGRIHTFGCYILPSLVLQNQYKWLLLRNEGQVIGFYHEVTASSTISRLATLSDGASQEGKRLVPQFAASIYPGPPIAGPNAGLFFSSASFNEVQRVEVCRISSRCSGLLLYYANKAPAVLGQWHTSPKSRRSCIYDMNRPRPETICFKMTTSRNYRIVTDVSFTSEEDVDAVSDVNYQTFNLGKCIAWWFSEFYDVVTFWDGEYLDIPRESQMA